MSTSLKNIHSFKKNFPLYDNDGKCVLSAKFTNKGNISNLKQLIREGKLILIENHCMCKNEHTEQDIVISEKDRYGFAIPQVLCSKCGLIRSRFVFDEISNSVFYANYYRGIYAQNIDKPMDSLWNDQYNRGLRILNFIKNIISLDDISNLSEIGTGMGGVLMPFKEVGFHVSGCDFDERYIEYGKQKGLDLYCGSFYDFTCDDSCDLIILCHVLEHYLDPIKELKKILPKLKNNRYLYVEVPGIFSISKTYKNPLLYFQNAHVYNFYKDFLWTFFESLGLYVVYGDEVCRFVVQKKSKDIPNIETIYTNNLSNYPTIIANYLINAQTVWRKERFLLFIRKVANSLGLNYPIKLMSYLLKHFIV